MNKQPLAASADLAMKIARLVEERGWNQEEFARIANLNRHTVRQILQPAAERRLRNATVGACAKALNLSVHELRTLPLERLLPRMRSPHPANGDDNLRRLYEQASQPELLAWMERNPERALQLTPDEVDELLSLQGTGGPLTTFGVDHYVNLIERKRKLMQKVQAIAGTEYIELLEKLVELMYDKVQPYGDRM
jgi:transcriptional regulator with XRE-family HTH domain